MKKILKLIITAIIIFVASFIMVFIGVKVTGGFGNRFVNPSSSIHSISWKETLEQLPTIFIYSIGIWVSGMIGYFYFKKYYLPKK